MSSSPNKSSITLHGECAFKYVVRQLHLSPEEYATSAALKEWVRRNKDHKYVPAQFLEMWHFYVDDELFGKAAKPPKRAA